MQERGKYIHILKIIPQPVIPAGLLSYGRISKREILFCVLAVRWLEVVVCYY